MKPTGQRAVIIFIDNSAMSIDGDFIPDRLSAQIDTVKKFAQNLFSYNASSNLNSDMNEDSLSSGNLDFDGFFDSLDSRNLEFNDSVIAVGTLGSDEFGIRTSFTSNLLKLENTLNTISSGGTALLERAIKVGYMALKHAPESAQLKMIFFLNSCEIPILENSMDDKKISELNKKILENKKIIVNFIVIGNNNRSSIHSTFPNLQQHIPNFPFPQNKIFAQNSTSNPPSKSKKSDMANNGSSNLLQRIIKKAKNATILIIYTCDTILSDVVMANELGFPELPGTQLIHGSSVSNRKNSNVGHLTSEFDGFGFQPNIPGFNPGNIGIPSIAIPVPENELNPSQIPLAVSMAPQLRSIPPIKNEIMYGTPIGQIPLQRPKSKRGRKPKYSPSFSTDSIMSSGPPNPENNLTVPQILVFNADPATSQLANQPQIYQPAGSISPTQSFPAVNQKPIIHSKIQMITSPIKIVNVGEAEKVINPTLISNPNPSYPIEKPKKRGRSRKQNNTNNEVNIST